MTDPRNTFALSIVITGADMSRAVYEMVYKTPGDLGAALRAFAEAVDGATEANPTQLMQQTLKSKRKK